MSPDQSAPPTRLTARALATAFALSGVVACDDGPGTVTPAAIRFIAQPPTSVAGTPFSARVEVLDDNGTRIQNARILVAVNVDGSVLLSGATSVAAVGGVAVFDDLVITRSGNAYRLEAESRGRTAFSNAFTVGPATPSSSHSSFAPDAFQWFEGTATSVVFTFADAFGNPIPGVQVSIGSSLGGTFTPASGVTDDAGAFTTAFSPAVGGSATFQATVDGNPVTFAAPFVVTEVCSPDDFPVPGQVAGVLPSGDCVMSGRSTAVYRVTAPQSGAVAITTTGAFQPRVDMRIAIAEPAPQFLPFPNSPTNEWLLPPGEYLFRIGVESGSGAYTVQSAAINGADGTAARAIIRSGTYAQALALSDRDFGDDTVYDYFYLFSPRPCTITMRSTELDSYLWAEDAIFESFIAQNDNGGGGQDARLHFSACHQQGNPIGIFANSNPTPQGPDLGAYTLTVEFGALPGAAAIAANALVPAPATGELRAFGERPLPALRANRGNR